MTVSTIASIAEFVTNGVTTNYPFYFKFLANEDLVVTYINPAGTSTVLTLGTHYTVNGAGKEEGGSVVTTTALAGPGQLIVSREMDAYQQTSLRNQGKFLAETHEDVFDKLTMLIQQGLAGNGRALKRPVGKAYFDAEGRIISHVADPVADSDAATRGWASRFFGALIDGATGIINTTTGILYDGGTLFDYLRFGVARTVDSVAALRQLSGARNQRAFVLGYYAKGDGGGGEYFVDMSDTTTADDGGSVIVGSDGARWKLSDISKVSVKQFGAKGIGTDDTVFINAALHVSLNVFTPPGEYLLSASLRGPRCVQFYGENAETTKLVRNGQDYGHTLELGEESSDPSKNANSCHVHGLWFQRNFSYTPGVTTFIPDPLQSTTAHIKLNGGQKAIIENCMIWNTPILIDVLSSSLVTIRNNGLLSMIWDNRTPALQEGFAAIQLRDSAVMSGHTQLVNIHGNHINGGYFSQSRLVTTGSVTSAMVECIGALYGVYVTSCEGLSVYDNYLGAFNANNIYLYAIGLVTNVKVFGNFIDGSRDYAILTNCISGNPTVGLQIFGNDFNIQLINLGAVYAISAGWTTVTKLSIVGNNIENSIQTPILLFSAAGVTIQSNNISAYNVRRGGDGNSLYAAGILVGGGSSRVFASGNSYGGNVNDIGSGNGCRWGIYFDSASAGYATDEYDLGRSLGAGIPLVFGGMAVPATPVQAIHNAASGNFQLLPSHSVYIRTGAATTATVAGLPAAPAMGQEILFKDQSNASAFPVVIQDTATGVTIDGSSTVSISTTNAFLKLRFNGTQWNRIG